ncbi:MAG: 3D domain-containing protein [Blastocatellia bacterium]
MLLQVGLVQSNINAQSLTVDQQAKSSITSSFLSSSNLALASRLSDNLSDKNKSEAKVEAPREPIAAPKIGPKNPSVDLKITPGESKLTAAAFESPDGLSKPLNFRATAYALWGRTRSGAYVRRGVIAADPRVLPLGSVVQVKAGDWSGTYTVHDTGGRIKGKIIDVWVPSNKEARKFGRRNVKLHVLRLGPKK